MKTLKTTALALALICLPAAQAHDDATLDAMPSPHGGQVRMSGPYHFELVAGQNQLTVYVTDHAMQPVVAEGVTGNAIVLSGEKATIPLKAAGGNVVKGEGAFQAGPEMKVVVSLTFPDANQWQARFTPWEKMQAAARPAPQAPTQAVPGMGTPMDHSMHH